MRSGGLAWSMITSYNVHSFNAVFPDTGPIHDFLKSTKITSAPLCKPSNGNQCLISQTPPCYSCFLVIELVIRKRISTRCFPTSSFKIQSPPVNDGTIGISRFAFVLGRLVEFSLIIHIPAGMDGEAAVAYSRKVMDGFWLSLRT